MVPLPFKPIPIASVRQFIELAVYIPEQDPQPCEEEPAPEGPGQSSYSGLNHSDESAKNLFRLYRNAKFLLERDTDHYDPEQAILLLTTAAEQGFVWAQYLLGKTLLRGELTEPDAERAKELLEAAFSQGNRYAAYTLGKALLDDELLPQDIPAALERLAFSAEDGFSAAQYLYGKLLFRGEVLPRDIPSALRYLEAAAAQENAFAAYLAARIYLTEESCRSIADAVRLLERAAELGNDYAEYLLGKLYLFGKEVPQDTPLALYWLRTSAEHGNPYAAQLLHSYNGGSLWPSALGALRLLQQLARSFENREQEHRNNLRQQSADRKLLRIIEEKRQAHGLKQG